MHKLSLFIVSFSLLLALSYGKVRPFGARPIVLSSTNAGETSDYNFTMTLDTELPSNGVIEITFPVNQYIAGLGLPYSIKVFAPYPNQITATLDTDTAKTVICNVGYRKANTSFTVEIRDVKNPLKIGGTGSFKISSKVGSKILDTNNNFGLIGIYEDSTTLLSAEIDFVDGASERSGEYTSYILTLIPSINLPSNVDVKVIFPVVYDLSLTQNAQCSEIGGLNLSITCLGDSQLKNVIIFQGFNQSLSQGTVIQLQLKDVLNPQNQMTTEALSFWVREVGTNNTIQKAEGVPGLVIQPGTISSVMITNPRTNLPLYTNIDRELILSFRPSNPFNAIKIATSFPLIKSCTVINGLSMVNEITPILCSASSHVMIIKGQKTYNPQDIYLKVIQVKFLATLPSTSVKTNKVEIYTYLDLGFINLVDQDTDTAASQVQIITLTTTTSVSSSLGTSSTAPSAANTLTYSISPSVTYTAASQIVIELSRDFTGLPTCTFAQLDSSTFNAKTCVLSKGVLTVTLNDDIGFFTATSVTPARVKVTGLYNPAIPKTYYSRYYIYSSAGALVETSLTSFAVVKNSISTISMLPLADALDHATIYSLQFTLPNFLEDGLFLLDEPNKLSSRIDILFKMKYSTSDTFYYDMGSHLADRTNYPCELVGLSPSVFASAPRCILIQGPSTGATTNDAAIIRVVDFNAALQGQSIIINIPVKNSQYGSTSPTAVVRTYTIKDYQEYITSESTQTLVATTSNFGTTSTGSSGTLTNSSVQAKSNLQFSFSVTSAITSGSNSSIQIEYPAGYKFLASDITVKLDGTTVNPNKLHFANVFNFFTIELSSNLATGSHTILVNNMTTPNASLSSGNNLVVRTTQNHAYVQSITLPLPTITPGADAGGLAMSITPNTYSYPYGAYQFNFTTAAYSPNTASIQVIFPASYTFDSYAECTNILGLVDLSAAYPVTCGFSGNTLTITQFQALVPGTYISISAFGITNPATAVTGSSYTLNILDSSSNKIESLSVTGTASTITGPTFTSRDLNISVSQMTPQNPLVDAAYKLTFDPGYNLPKGAIMTITFDSDFSVLFTKTIDLIDCVAQGGLYSLTQCSTTGVTLTVQFGQTTNASIPVDINYFGLISYPHNGTVLTGFSATVTYKGSTIASSSTFPTITTSQEIVPLTDITMDYYPRNEGEMANYYFTFNLTTTELNDTMYFLVRFPHEYDPDLFKYSPVAESPQLIGHLVPQVLSRQIIITGFQNMTVTGPITLRLWGVVNPNKVDISKTGTFTVALMYGNDVIEGNFQLPGIVPLLAPDNIRFTSLNSDSPYARHNTDYEFTFLSRADILPSKLGGYLFVDFPPPNFLIDSYAGKCDINEDFSFFVSCTLDNNRIFVNSSNPTWTSLMGALTLSLQDIRTADDNGETLNIVVSNYDSQGKKVLSRTYSNLNPASLTYSYDGLLITVNNDQPVDVEVGTYTDEIVIQMPGPSLQAITLTPNTLDARILVTPFPLKIDLGDTQVKFRVAAPREMLLQSYYITWSKTGDSLVTTYANLRRTNLRMRSGWIKRQVGSENMEFIPIGGITFPLLVLTNNPPYDELIVNMWVKNSDPLASISKSSVTFERGEFNQNYTIVVDPTHAYPSFVEIGLSVSGKDSPSYILTNNTVYVPITAKEVMSPDIISASVLSTTRSTATFTFTTNTLSFIYYVIAYKNVPIPTFADVSKKVITQTLKYSNPIFGESYIKQTPKTVNFTVTGLTPGKDYDMYAYIMNLNQINNPVFKKLSFSTNKPHRIAEFILPIKQSTVTSDIKKEIISRIAQMLSVDRTRLIEKFTDCVQSQDSLYYHAANMTYFHLYLLPDPTSENDNSTPLLLVRNLNSRTAEIKQFIPRLADGDLLQIQDLPYDIPTFTVRPSYTTSAYEALTFTVTLTRCGYIHAVAIPVALSQNSTATLATVYQSESTNSSIYPTSFQTYSGYDMANQPAISSTMRVKDFSQDYTFVVSGLTNHLIYNVYISTENDWPAYTEILPDASVAQINAKTVKRKVPLNVFSINIREYVRDDDSGIMRAQITWLGLFMAIILAWIA